MNFTEFFKDEGGESTVSLVICIMPLMYIFAMLISFGQALYGVQVAANASATGARAAAVNGNSTSAYAAANQIAKEYVDRAGMGITFESDDLKYSIWNRKGELEYFVTVKVKTAMPIMGSGIKESFSPTRSCPAIIEGE